MSDQQREAMAGQRQVVPDPDALEPTGWAKIEKQMYCVPAGLTRREELLLQIRMTALECASRTTPDLDPEVTTQTADKFVKWICEGI